MNSKNIIRISYIARISALKNQNFENKCLAYDSKVMIHVLFFKNFWLFVFLRNNVWNSPIHPSINNRRMKNNWDFRWRTMPPKCRGRCFAEIEIRWKFDLARIRQDITSTIFARFVAVRWPYLAWFKRWDRQKWLNNLEKWSVVQSERSFYLFTFDLSRWFIKIIQDSFIQLKRFYHYRQLSRGLWHGTTQKLKMEFHHVGPKWIISFKKGF